MRALPTFAACLGLLAPSIASALPQSAPACLSPFQSVELPPPPGGSVSVRAVKVSGDRALVLARLFGQADEAAVFAVRRDPSTLLWEFHQRVAVDSATSNTSRLALDGHWAAVQVQRGVTQGVALLRFEGAADEWRETQFIPVTGSLSKVQIAGDTLAVSADSFRQWIHLYSLKEGRRAVWETSLRSLDPTLNGFSDEFDLAPGRLVSTHLSRFDVFERNGAGIWGPVATLPLTPGVGALTFAPRVAVHGDRIMFECRDLANSEEGLGLWRYGNGGAGASIAFDGGVFTSDLGAPLRRQFLAFGEGTALVDLEGPGCGGLDPDRRQIAVLDMGVDGAWEVGGAFCDFAGFTSAARLRGMDYDGRTVAVTAYGAIGQPLATVQLATLLGSDLDRDRNCVEDAQQIAVQPDLDRNVNGTLDAFEERGALECPAAAPNSTGSFGELRLIGSEFTGSTDLAAVVSGLPSGALAFLAVAPSPLPGAASGPLGLCIGSGAGPGQIGRYSAVFADSGGVAVVDVRPFTTPLAGGTAEALRGETWGWQLIYRDGASVQLTNAVRLTLE